MQRATDIPEIVLFSFFPWEHEYPSTAHGLAKALAAHTRVWFVSKPPTWKDALTKRGRVRTFGRPVIRAAAGFGERLQLVDLPPVLPINGLPTGRAYETLRAVVDNRLNALLGKVLSRAGVRDFVFLNLYAPTYFRTLSLHRPPLKHVYYTVDAIGQATYTAKHGVLAEAHQHERADLSLGTSTRLVDSIDAAVAEKAVLPNAMAADLYLGREPLPEPEDLRGIPHPRICYVGNLDGARLDFQLLAGLAQKHPGQQLILVGPWNAGDALREEFAALPNVHLLGRKNPEDCPAYLQHADVGVIPFRVTPLTAAIYPLKINEYLAMGLPVVATPFSEDIAAFDEVISVAPAEDWPRAVSAELANTAPQAVQRRRAMAADNTWDARARQFLELIGAAVPTKSLEVAC